MPRSLVDKLDRADQVVASHHGCTSGREAGSVRGTVWIGAVMAMRPPEPRSDQTAPFSGALAIDSERTMRHLFTPDIYNIIS